MTGKEAMDSAFLFSMSKAFCSPLAVFIQIQVCFFLPIFRSIPQRTASFLTLLSQHTASFLSLSLVIHFYRFMVAGLGLKAFNFNSCINE